MDNSTPSTISETDKENPLYPLQLHNIANAKTEEELRTAIEQSVSGLNNSDEKIVLWQHQKAVKEFLSDPTNVEKGNKMAETVQKCANLIAVRSGNKLRSSVLEVDKDSVREVRKSLITQFQAAGIAELMLVDLAISSYFRALNTNRAYGLLLNNGMRSDAPQEQINFYKELGRQIEFANKQFATALTLLKEFKQPPIKVKIQTKNAYVAGNQQVNQYGNNGQG
ncbi:MAG: hypothetical protein A2687_05940 [Candidatus Levybacteria bacterium RIFCSPHIGHO2_01_FULL_38_26]|nr:MAG: hypothetical protein A2687_05940 [Candidatus Levybacteria bacterium RIFCSPHIGHO2_01_FULL_38_26]